MPTDPEVKAAQSVLNNVVARLDRINPKDNPKVLALSVTGHLLELGPMVLFDPGDLMVLAGDQVYRLDINLATDQTSRYRINMSIDQSNVVLVSITSDAYNATRSLTIPNSTTLLETDRDIASIGYYTSLDGNVTMKDSLYSVPNCGIRSVGMFTSYGLRFPLDMSRSRMVLGRSLDCCASDCVLDDTCVSFSYYKSVDDDGRCILHETLMDVDTTVTSSNLTLLDNNGLYYEINEAGVTQKFNQESSKYPSVASIPSSRIGSMPGRYIPPSFMDFMYSDVGMMECFVICRRFKCPVFSYSSTTSECGIIMSNVLTIMPYWTIPHSIDNTLYITRYSQRYNLTSVDYGRSITRFDQDDIGNETRVVHYPADFHISYDGNDFYFGHPMTYTDLAYSGPFHRQRSVSECKNIDPCNTMVSDQEGCSCDKAVRQMYRFSDYMMGMYMLPRDIFYIEGKFRARIKRDDWMAAADLWDILPTSYLSRIQYRDIVNTHPEKEKIARLYLYSTGWTVDDVAFDDQLDMFYKANINVYSPQAGSTMLRSCMFGMFNELVDMLRKFTQFKCGFETIEIAKRCASMLETRGITASMGAKEYVQSCKLLNDPLYVPDNSIQGAVSRVTTTFAEEDTRLKLLAVVYSVVSAVDASTAYVSQVIYGAIDHLQDVVTSQLTTINTNDMQIGSLLTQTFDTMNSRFDIQETNMGRRLDAIQASVRTTNDNLIAGIKGLAIGLDSSYTKLTRSIGKSAESVATYAKTLTTTSDTSLMTAIQRSTAVQCHAHEEAVTQIDKMISRYSGAIDKLKGSIQEIKIEMEGNMTCVQNHAEDIQAAAKGKKFGASVGNIFAALGDVGATIAKADQTRKSLNKAKADKLTELTEKVDILKDKVAETPPSAALREAQAEWKSKNKELLNLQNDPDPASFAQDWKTLKGKLDFTDEGVSASAYAGAVSFVANISYIYTTGPYMKAAKDMAKYVKHVEDLRDAEVLLVTLNQVTIVINTVQGLLGACQLLPPFMQAVCAIFGAMLKLTLSVIDVVIFGLKTYIAALSVSYTPPPAIDESNYLTVTDTEVRSIADASKATITAVCTDETMKESVKESCPTFCDTAILIDKQASMTLKIIQLMMQRDIFDVTKAVSSAFAKECKDFTDKMVSAMADIRDIKNYTSPELELSLGQFIAEGSLRPLTVDPFIKLENELQKLDGPKLEALSDEKYAIVLTYMSLATRYAYGPSMSDIYVYQQHMKRTCDTIKYELPDGYVKARDPVTPSVAIVADTCDRYIQELGRIPRYSFFSPNMSTTNLNSDYSTVKYKFIPALLSYASSTTFFSPWRQIGLCHRLSIEDTTTIRHGGSVTFEYVDITNGHNNIRIQTMIPVFKSVKRRSSVIAETLYASGMSYIVSNKFIKTYKDSADAVAYLLRDRYRHDVVVDISKGIDSCSGEAKMILEETHCMTVLSYDSPSSAYYPSPMQGRLYLDSSQIYNPSLGSPYTTYSISTDGMYDWKDSDQTDVCFYGRYYYTI
ncbi:hypothetical protein HDU86_001510 [Geranomyces michiganensis]|nr:hypothetical protein HDU86_001510 [Geranomyces michiganensis]